MFDHRSRLIPSHNRTPAPLRLSLSLSLYDVLQVMNLRVVQVMVKALNPTAYTKDDEQDTLVAGVVFPLQATESTGDRRSFISSPLWTP